MMLLFEAANGLRYPRVGGRRQRHFAGTDFKPRKLLENAQTPTRRVHALLGGVCFVCVLLYVMIDPSLAQSLKVTFS